MKILVGYDGSRAAENALKLARNHAIVFNADIYLITSLEQSHSLQKEDIEKAEDNLDDLKRHIGSNGIHCETDVVVSYLSAGEAMVQFIQENDIDEVFVGIKKKSKLDKLVFGSTAQYVILHAPCPVMLVK